MSGMVHVICDIETSQEAESWLQDAGYDCTKWENAAKFVLGVSVAEGGCVLVNASRPGTGGLRLQRTMAEQGIDMPLVLLIDTGNVSTAVAGIRAGATDVIERPLRRERLLNAIATAFQRLDDAGGRFLSPAGAGRRIAQLTNREQQVLAGMARGDSNKVIAISLGLSPRTVEVHRANLMFKLHVSSLSEALHLVFIADLPPNHRIAAERRGPLPPLL